jgi:hypothetical protein
MGEIQDAVRKAVEPETHPADPIRAARAALALKLAEAIDGADAETPPAGALIKEFRGVLADLEPRTPVRPAVSEGSGDDGWADLGTPV